MTLAGDFEEARSELFQGQDEQLVLRHVRVEHDVEEAEVGLDGLQVHAADVASLLLILRVGHEAAGQCALERGVDHDGARLGFADAAIVPGHLREIEHIVRGQLGGGMLGAHHVGGDGF